MSSGSSDMDAERSGAKAIKSAKAKVTFAEGVSLALRATAKVSSAPMGKDTELPLLASLSAMEQTDEHDVRNPVDLVIVLDVSGSMTGVKLDLCKQTINFLVDHALTEKDALGIVTFSNHVKVEYRGGKMTPENKEAVRSIVANIGADGSTNLSDGLFGGLEVLSELSATEVSAVCLLTDGRMNMGITASGDLISETTQRINGPLFENKAKPSVFTFGYGTDVDANFLKQLSDAADGTYYWIENPEGVPLAFADCLGGLTSVAAQGIVLECNLPEGVEFASAPLTSFGTEQPTPSKYVVKIKDMYCGEDRDLIFMLRIKESTSSDIPAVIQLSCTFTDTINERVHTITSPAAITRYAGTADPTEAPDAEVMRHLARYEALNALKEAQQQAAQGRLAEARRHLHAGTKAFRLAARDYKDDDDDKDCNMMDEILQDMNAAQSTFSSHEEYQRRGESFMQRSIQTHSVQRSNRVDSYLGDLDVDQALSSAAYVNTAKRRMLSRSVGEFGV